MAERIGYYICHCGINIAHRVRVAEVAEYIGTLPNVVVSRDYLFMCSDPGQELIEKDIHELGLTRVVVASCSPRMHENTFRAVCERAGLNAFRAFHHVCVREHASWVHDNEDIATEKAKRLSRAGVFRVANQRDLYPATFPVNTNTLIVGGGIAGMQAALDIAKSGNKAYLVERTPTVGGHMLQYDKTFPTLDCAACIGTPKMVSVGQNPNIELLTMSGVEEVSGFVGNFKVKVNKRARFVETNCTGCGECASVCPVQKRNEWDDGTRLRTAIHRPFPQAVPIWFNIDKRDRAPCVQTCPAHTNVQGYVALTKAGKFEEAVRLIRERLPLPGVLGRVCAAPCEGQCRRAEVDSPVSIRNIKRFVADQVDVGDIAVPLREVRSEKVAVVGAGPAGLTCAYFLGRAGYPVTVFDAAPVLGGMLRLGIPDYRLPPAVLEAEVRWLEKLGVELKTDHPIGQHGKQTVDGLFAEGYQAVFLGIGAHGVMKLGLPDEDAPGIEYGVDFLRRANLGEPVEVGERVVVIGGGAVAADVARVARRKGAREVGLYCLESRAEMPAWEDDIRGMEAEGITIHNSWGPLEFLKDGDRATGVRFKRCVAVFDDEHRFAPRFDESETVDVEADRVYVAIGQRVEALSLVEGTEGVECSPRGLIVADPVTLETSRPGLFAGGDAVTGPRIAIDAVGAGQQAAWSIQAFLEGRDLRSDRPASPHGQNWAPLPDWIGPAPRTEMPETPVDERLGGFSEVELGFSAEDAQQEADRCVACGGCSECMLCVDACKPGAVNHAMQDETVELDVGSIIVATGFNPMDPSGMEEYGYSRFPNVITNLEFERLSNATGPTSGKLLLRDEQDPFKHTRPPESVAILHCIGSRDKNHHEYCSRTCCMYALKYAHLLKDKCGEQTEVYNFYIDMRCFGKGYEEFYNRVQAEGVRMIRGKAARITDETLSEEEEGKLVVIAEDTLTNQLVRVPVEMAILCTAMEPRKTADEVARTFGISIGSEGFFLEEHPKLEPVSTPTGGVFLAGACQGPKDIPDTVAQAKAAAAEALALSSAGEVTVSPMISNIDPDVCVGCQVCIGLCAYTAIEFDDRRAVSVVNEALCKGCGSCAGYCPSGAAKVRHFTDQQVFAEIDGLLA